ncbi:transposase [Undibacterium curvum]|uniref:transposase n=1 Tax=Undibacterium curvum TaxID=2762294 RepID=UPI003D10A518
MIRISKETKSGLKVANLCRKYGISEATYYNWKAMYGGITVSDAQKLKALEVENAKLKRLLAETMLNSVALKEVVSQKS